MPGYALVCPVTEEQTGGFIIQEVAIEKQQKGVVMAVGKAVKNEWGTLIETDVVPGDIIYHRAWGHETIQVDGKEYRVVKFLDICLKVETNQ